MVSQSGRKAVPLMGGLSLIIWFRFAGTIVRGRQRLQFPRGPKRR
jgi:hypothetical protein